MRSMTGFCEKKFTTKDYSLSISIKTLNHRYFDWYFRGNFHSMEIEDRFRKIAQREFKRGRIEVSMDLEFFPSFNWEIHINENLFEKILHSLRPILKKMKGKLIFPLDFFLHMPGMFSIKPYNLKNETDFLEKCFMEVIEGVKEHRKREGEFIKGEIINCFKKIESYVEEIKKLTVNQATQIEEKLRERIGKVKLPEISEERLAQEVFFYIQRIDIKEEINRIEAHLEQVSRLINLKTDEPVGKKIEFLLQEIHREVNTINSKSQDINIINFAVNIKSEIEKIKQHIQNIE